MRHIIRFISVILSIAVLMAILIFPSSADSGSKEIPGIDYNRITQKAEGGKQSYKVDLKLGSVTFTGELVGQTGISIEELNEIIQDTLREKNLTIDRIKLISKLASQVEKDARMYWGDQIVEGLLSFIPVPPGSPMGINDYYAYVVHGEVNPAIQSVSIEAATNAAEMVIVQSIENGGRIGRIAQAVEAGADKVPMLGEIVNTAKVAHDWSKGSERLDNYLKLLEKNLEIVNDFYATCSRRAVALAESNNKDSVWKIKFDEKKNYRTYNCDFWGISGNTMSVTLSGELVSSGGGPESSYSGTLKLEFNAVDFSPVEKNLERTSGLAQFVNVLHSMGAYQKVSDSGEKTILRRSAQGHVTVYVGGSEGKVKPEFSGSLTSGGDETIFSFRRDLEWRDESMASAHAEGITEAHFVTADIDELTARVSSRVLYKGEVKTEQNSIEEFSQDPGTVFDPLDRTPVITINFN
ncbi:MAG: hypothetical protein K6F14_04280 [Clostridiales bacterium]|nr:hypothetical protein [Clostridiales bacterium]